MSNGQTSSVPPVPSAFLDAAGVAYEVLPHSRAVFTVHEAARERGVCPSQIVKVMVVRRSSGALSAVLVPGDRSLSLRKLRHALGESRLRLASQEEIEAATGAILGALSPLGIHKMLSMYVDFRVGEEEVVSISSGRPDAGLLLRSDDLLRIVGGIAGDYS